jgi:hypothetical protein
MGEPEGQSLWLVACEMGGLRKDLKGFRLKGGLDDTHVGNLLV